jgi:hypothetical protein
MANVQENVILLYSTFYFSKTCVETWNFALPKKLDLRKTKLSCDRPSSFYSRYPNICDTTKKMDYSQIVKGLAIGYSASGYSSIPSLGQELQKKIASVVVLHQEISECPKPECAKKFLTRSRRQTFFDNVCFLWGSGFLLHYNTNCPTLSMELIISQLSPGSQLKIWNHGRVECFRHSYRFGTGWGGLPVFEYLAD